MTKLGSQSGSLNPDLLFGESSPGVQGPKGDKGDQGDPGVVQSVVAGTNITVDATDPANPIVSSTAAGGGGATYTQDMGPTNITISTSAYATKGIWFTVDETLTVHSVECLLDPNSGETYKVVLVKEEDLTPRQIASVLGTSNTSVAAPVSSTSEAQATQFVFSTPVQLTADASAQYAALCVLTSGIGTTACRISFPGETLNPNGPHLTAWETTRVADNSPAVGEDFSYQDGTPAANTGLGVMIHYTLG